MAFSTTKIVVGVLVLLVVVLTIFLAYSVDKTFEEIVFGKTFCSQNPQYCQKAKYRQIIPSIPTRSFDADFKGYLMLTANVMEGLYESMNKPKTQYYQPHNATNVHIIENKDYPSLALFCEMNKQGFLFVRGTKSVADAEVDINYQQTRNSSGNLVHKGFYDLYMNIIKPQLEYRKVTWSNYDSIFIAGHSLGAATAIIAAAEIQAANKIPEANLHCLAIAPPRAGSPEFASRQMNQNFVSVINLADIIPALPLSIMSYFGKIYFYEHGGKIITFAHNYQDLQMNHNSYMYLDHFVPPPSVMPALPSSLPSIPQPSSVPPSPAPSPSFQPSPPPAATYPPPSSFPASKAPASFVPSSATYARFIP